MKLKLPHFVVTALVNHAKKTPFDHLPGYMNRWWILDPKGFFSKWFTVRIHEILRGDADRHLHDHPWSYTTIILKGGYTEVTHHNSQASALVWANDEGDAGATRTFVRFNSEMRKWEVRCRYDAGCVLHRKAGFPHRLEVEPGEIAVTCFIMGKYQNKWGFYTPEGKIYWCNYLDKDDVTKRAKVIEQHYKAHR